jgi:hypothetical protein
MKLLVPHVDGVNLPCAAREQHIREAAGGGADIETDASRGIEAEMIERRDKLHASARDPRMRGLRAQRRMRRNFIGGFAQHGAVGRHQARGDRSLRSGAALKQAALDENDVCALARDL